MALMRLLSLSALSAVLAGSAPLGAQTAGQSSGLPPAGAPVTADTPAGSKLRPTARGLQGALRSGLIIPWGDATDAPGDALGDRASWQVPLFLDAGFKINKPIWIGVYAGLGFGVAASDENADTACSSDDASCSVLSLQLGLQAQYQFGASETYNPWVSYGAGYEFVQQSISLGDYQESTSASGITYARLGAGLDYRGDVGLGPYVEASAGQFAASTTEIDDDRVYDGPIDGAAWHGWFMFGVRVVMNP
jgi:hypothetical protein